MPPIHIDTSLLEHRFFGTICGGIQTAHSGATLRQEVILSSNMDGMSIGVTAVGLMRRVRLRGHLVSHMVSHAQNAHSRALRLFLLGGWTLNPEKTTSRYSGCVRTTLSATLYTERRYSRRSSRYIVVCNCITMFTPAVVCNSTRRLYNVADLSAFPMPGPDHPQVLRRLGLASTPQIPSAKLKRGHGMISVVF